MLKHYKIKTKYNDVYDITKEVRQAVEESGVEEGICIVYNPHSTAGITVFSPWDPDGFVDLDEEICRLCDHAMCGDRGIAESFGCELELPATIARGDDLCQIRFVRR